MSVCVDVYIFIYILLKLANNTESTQAAFQAGTYNVFLCVYAHTQTHTHTYSHLYPYIYIHAYIHTVHIYSVVVRPLLGAPHPRIKL
jgi:hypothetical protein